MQSSEWKVRFLEVYKQRHGGLVLAFIKQASGSVAMPTIRVFQGGNQFCGGNFAQFGRLRVFEIVRCDTINSASVVTTVQIEKSFDIIRQRPGVLDDFAIHVDDIERSIRRVCKLNRAKPGVSRGDKLDVFFAGATLSLQFHS